jgi:hypothetical protein
MSLVPSSASVARIRGTPMANNYTLFSEAIKKPTKRELTWLLKEYNRRTPPGPNVDLDETMGDFTFNIEAGDAYVYSDEGMFGLRFLMPKYTLFLRNL